MTQWRIRLIVPEAAAGRRALRTALAQGSVTGVRLDPPGVDVTEMTGDVIIELAEDGALGDLLRALHEISPQVFISRVSAPEPGADQPIMARKLTPIGAYPQRRATGRT
jgi:hypothetical protein